MLMCRAFRSGLAVLCFALVAPPGWGEQEVFMPGPNAVGYSNVPQDTTQKAPEGYEGQTHKLVATSTGNTPATKGRVFVLNLLLSNEIKICPKADGTSEGEGEYSVVEEFSDDQGNAGKIAMDAKAKYKGKVGDDALLDGPVKADIDYTYSRSGSFPDKSGTIFSPPAVNVQQHVTMDITVGAAGSNDIPGLSGWVAGNVAQDRISNAFDAANAVAFWAGVYYGVAETEWTHGGCVLVVFDPPSHTVKPAPGTQVKVKTQVQTRDGEITKAHLVNAQPFAGSNVEPGEGVSDVGAPLTFTFTAPLNKPTDGLGTGFQVDAVSRAGVAKDQTAGDWKATLGKDWGGQITYSSTRSGDTGHNDLQTWAFSANTFFMIWVQDGAADASGHAEESDLQETRQGVFSGGSVTMVVDHSSSTLGSVEGFSKGKVHVDLDMERKTYRIRLDLGLIPPGRASIVDCDRKKGCTPETQPFYIVPNFQSLIESRAFDDPNHVHGSKTTVANGLGRGKNGTLTETLTWDLARDGVRQ
jgi:hypothetical protein